MKNYNILVLFSSLFFFTFAACNNAPEGEKVEAKAPESKIAVAGAQTIQLTPEDCTITWKGTKAVGGGHKGNIKIKTGNLAIKGKKIVGGSVTIDMNSISNSDIQDAGKNADLVGHLKNDDFFDVANHPTATFDITKVSDEVDGFVKVTGNLTIKGISKSIEIPAKVTIDKGGIKLRSRAFTINRTEWGIKFHSGLLGTAKDRIINDNIGLAISLTARYTK